MSKKKKHGGSRQGAGRKPTPNPKQAITVRVKQETIDKIDRLSEKTGKSKAYIVEQAVKKVRKIT